MEMESARQVPSMIDKEKFLLECREQWKNKNNNICRYRIKIPTEVMPENYFNEFLVALGSVAMVEQGDRHEFRIDESNKEIIHQLYLYVTDDKAFPGDLDKGIALMGKIGAGKTVIMKGFKMVANHYFLKYMCNQDDFRYYDKSGIIGFYSSYNIFNQINENSGLIPLGLTNEVMIIDELGREPMQGNKYGNTYTPLIHFLSERYSRGVVTHATTNFSLEDLSSDKYYGKVVGDRLKAMFNFILLPGNSRRK